MVPWATPVDRQQLEATDGMGLLDRPASDVVRERHEAPVFGQALRETALAGHSERLDERGHIRDRTEVTGVEARVTQREQWLV
jgi:hypothetical protein